MKFEIYADLHLKGPAEMFVDPDFRQPAENRILLGDIVDMANIKKSEIETGREMIKSLVDVHGLNYVTGNHERTFWNSSLYMYPKIKGGQEPKSMDGILFTHGDLDSNEERWTKYRSKPYGASWLKRAFNRVISEFERHPPKGFFDRAAARAKSKHCGTYVCGHFHPDKIIDVIHNDVRIIIVPRGKTVLDL